MKAPSEEKLGRGKSRGASISHWAERIALDREFTKRTQFGGDSRPP
jgi:hypothetical protein